MESTDTEQGRGSARSRILNTAYELFCRHGIRAIGIDRIVDEAEVAKPTLYRLFGSKDDLLLACLDVREERWTRDWLVASIARRAEEPRGRIVAMFELFDEWFQEPDFEGCLFINTMLEIRDRSNRCHQAAVRKLQAIGDVIADDVAAAGIQDPDDHAFAIQGLLMGAIVSAGRGDHLAARRAQPMLELYLDAAIPTSK